MRMHGRSVRSQHLCGTLRASGFPPTAPTNPVVRSPALELAGPRNSPTTHRPPPLAPTFLHCGTSRLGRVRAVHVVHIWDSQMGLLHAQPRRSIVSLRGVVAHTRHAPASAVRNRCAALRALLLASPPGAGLSCLLAAEALRSWQARCSKCQERKGSPTVCYARVRSPCVLTLFAWSCCACMHALP